MVEGNAVAARAVGNDGAGEDPAVLRLVLGARLRRLREAAGISGQTAGRAIRASHSKISRLEAGRVGFRAMDIDDLLTLYGVEDPDTRADYLRLAQRANGTGRWQVDDDAGQRLDTFLALEDAAAMVRSYAPGVIPDLLQTAAYAHAVSAVSRPGPTADVQRRVELLMRRQRLIHRRVPPKLWLLIEEAVLRRPFGGVEVWRDQLDHLASAAARPEITVQILPDHIGGPAISAVPFTLLRFAEPDLGDIVHLNHATGAQFLDRRGDLDAYHAIWDRLCVHAAPPAHTGDAIAALLADRTDLWTR
ncbi:helix-turn-helix domain-containing protein [Nocardia mexicana]|uniref:Helix-turn-helix protein n=1 Tax=Nocardia mexicana TaxID=279262 RepID=A0A370H266_9NOCA|nr:helix-turn-helix transcriptional regulator [Nocardia mexicana]RDI50105.1 helix-turn-helix protein [Nocardia mexicana]